MPMQSISCQGNSNHEKRQLFVYNLRYSFLKISHADTHNSIAQPVEARCVCEVDLPWHVMLAQRWPIAQLLALLGRALRMLVGHAAVNACDEVALVGVFQCTSGIRWYTCLCKGPRQRRTGVLVWNSDSFLGMPTYILFIYMAL